MNLGLGFMVFLSFFGFRLFWGGAPLEGGGVCSNLSQGERKEWIINLANFFLKEEAPTP